MNRAKLVVISFLLLVSGCSYGGYTYGSPSENVLPDNITLPQIVTPAPTQVLTLPMKQLTEPVSLPVSKLSHVALPNKNQSGIGVAKFEVELRSLWLKFVDLRAEDYLPIYNGNDEDSVFFLSYGIFEQRKDMVVAPDYFKSWVEYFNLVQIPAKSWVDVPVRIVIPKGTSVLPSEKCYFNIAVKDINQTGFVQYQQATRFEVTIR